MNQLHARPKRCVKSRGFKSLPMEISLSFVGQEPPRKDEKSHGGQEPPSKLARLDSSPSPKQRIVRTRPMEISFVSRNKKTSRNNSEEDESKEDDQNFLSDEDNGQEVTGYFTEEGIRKIQNHWRSLQ